ncbi:MAG: PfkB family carbohydrate kinase [Saprospiraceae bacterium]
MKQIVTFGEIMMRLSTPGNQRFGQATSLDIQFGGGEGNVAVALAHWDVPAMHVTCFPDNDLGRAVGAHLRRYGVDNKGIVYKGNRLGLYFLEVGACMRASRIVYDRADSAFANLQPEWFDWEALLQDAQWLHWTGITPAISESAAQACREAIQTARKLGITVSADVNYRRNLWQYGKTVQEVMPDLVAGCDVIVCAESDAADIFNIQPKEKEPNTFISVAQQLMERFPQIKKIITTRRETLSASYNKLKAILYNGQDYLETPVYDINPIVDRIGGGDAFMAGFIYGILHYNNEQAALNFANAASALKHTVEGDVNLVTVEEVEQVMQGDTSGRLLR